MAAVEPALPQPHKPPLVRALFALKPVWLPGQAAVAGIAVTIALAGVWSVSDAGSAVMSLAGAMTVLFARGEPYVHRARTVTGFALLVMVMSAGALWLADSRWTLLAVLTVMAGLAAAATEIMHTPVPGPALLLVPTTIVVGVPLTHTSELWHRIGMMAVGAAVALVVTLTPWMLFRQGPEQRAVVVAYRAIADAARSSGSARYSVDRSVAWTAVTRAQSALALARGVPGRNTEKVRRLCALGDHAPRVLHALELVALQEGTELPVRLLDHTQALPSVVARIAGGQAVTVHPAGQPASADPVVRALEQELADVPTVAARADARRAGQTDPAPTGSPRLLRQLCRREWALVVRVTVLTLITGAVTILIGLDRWYWAPVCAVATLWGSHTWMTWYRAVQRGLATAVGGVVGAALLQPRLPFPAVIAIVGVLFFLAELSFPSNYGLAMVFVTPMVLLTIQSASPVSLNAAALSWDRISTTLVGCVSGVLGVLLLLSSPSTRLLAERIGRSLALQQALVADVPAESTARRARLCALIRTDLAELHLLATDALGEARSNRRARTLWPVALAVSRTGYVLLALSALAPESWARAGRDGWRHDVRESTDAMARELASPRPQVQPLLDGELRLLRSVVRASIPGDRPRGVEAS